MAGTPSNDLNISQPGYVIFDGVSTFTGNTLQAGAGITITNPSGVAGNTIISSSTVISVTQFDVIVGGAANTLVSVGPGSAGQILRSGGNAANPAYSTSTYPSTAGTSGNVLTSDGTNWISSSPPGGGLITLTGTLTNTQIKNLHASPVTVLPAPGAGKCYFITYSVGKFIYGGTNAFIAGAAQIISFFYSTIATTNVTLISNANLTGTATVYSTGIEAPISSFSTSIENQPLTLYNSNATEITGNAANDNTVSYSITYQIMNI